MSTKRAVTAREYLRVSVDRSGVRRSPAEQHTDNARAAEALGVVFGEPYEDVGSASRYATKSRKNFERMLKDLRSGSFGSDLLWLWESSRGSRKVGEWVELIELCAEQHVKIHVTTHSRTYDPSNARDRRSLLEDAVDSEYDASKRSEQAKRAAAANAVNGKPHGRTPFGYRRRYDPVTRRFVVQEPEPAEAALVRELFERLHGGHSLRGIAKDWESRGVVNKSGRPFTPAHLRTLATTRAYVGEREHTPGRKGSHSSPSRPPAQVVEGIWESLVPRATFLAVQHILSAPERRTSRPGRANHLLSMIARCGECGGKLAARVRDGRCVYYCHVKGCQQVPEADLDELAEGAMLDYLSQPDRHKALAERDNGPELEAARAAVAEVQAELDDLAAQVGSGALSATLAARAEPAILARLHAAEVRKDELDTPSRLRGLIKPGKDVRRRWEAAPMETRREVARIMFAPDMLGELRLRRAPRGTPVGDRV